MRAPAGARTPGLPVFEVLQISGAEIVIELLPKPKLDTLIYNKVLDFPEEKAQGLAFSGKNIIYLSSKLNIFKLSVTGGNLYENPKFDFISKASLGDLIGSAGLNISDYDHIGDIDFFNGLVFLPVRNRHRENNMIIVLSAELELVGYSYLSNKTGDACCAVHPWSGLLLMTSKRDGRYLFLYDLSEYYKITAKKKIWGRQIHIRPLSKRFWFYNNMGIEYETVYSMQGLAFSQNGRLYLTRYNGSGPWFNYIHAYNGNSGMFLDKTKNNIDFPGRLDEIEGISVHSSGIIYIAVLLHNNFEPDRFQIYAFKFQDSLFPV